VFVVVIVTITSFKLCKLVWTCLWPQAKLITLVKMTNTPAYCDWASHKGEEKFYNIVFKN
jgi:hypothetical protein